MNKRFTIAVIIMAVAFLMIFAGCPVQNNGNSDEAQHRQELKAVFDRLDGESYTMDTTVMRQMGGAVWKERTELSRDGNIFFKNGQPDESVSACYYEFAPDGAVYQYKQELDKNGQTYWEKSPADKKSVFEADAFALAVDNSDVLFNEESYTYSSTDERFYLKSTLLPLENYIEGVVVSFNEERVTLEFIPVNNGYNQEALTVNFSKIGEIKLTLPDVEGAYHAKMLENAFSLMANGNFKIVTSSGYTAEGNKDINRIEAYFCGNIILLKQTVDGVTVNTYFEEDTDGIVYRYDEHYDANGNTRWIKEKTQIKDMQKTLAEEIFGRGSDAFDAENYEYLSQNGKYQLKKDLLQNGETGLFVKLDGGDILFELTAEEENEGNSQTSRFFTVSDFGKINITLPEA